MTLTLTDHRVKVEGESKTETFIQKVVKRVVKFLDQARTPIIEEPIYVKGKEDNVEVEVAMQYNSSFNEKYTL